MTSQRGLNETHHFFFFVTDACDRIPFNCHNKQAPIALFMFLIIIYSLLSIKYLLVFFYTYKEYNLLKTFIVDNNKR